MFIVKKIISGKEYYYLRKSVRDGKKIISKTVAYLGKDLKHAEEKKKEIEERLEKGEEFKNIIEELNKPFEEKKKITIDELANFCKEKGFVFRSSDIYGGYSGFWDLGPLGVELMNNIKNNWWNYFVSGREDMAGMEASIISHPKVWIASGHVANFNDLMIYCKKCKKFFRADHLIEDILGIVVEGKPKEEILKIIKDNRQKFLEKGYDLEEELKAFSLMFKTHVGTNDLEEAYLRGETAQGMFSDFKIIQQTSRLALPFGIAQIGKCFRNEIAPRDFLFRSREFHIGELEYFINPEEKKCNLFDDIQKNVKVKLLDSETQLNGKVELREITIGDMVIEKRLDEWHAYWLSEQLNWFYSLGLTEIKIREHKKDELSHYSTATFDIDYMYPFGSKEVAGNANRGQYDLTTHEKSSGEKMAVFDEKYKNKLIPRVIEPTFGIERVFLAILTKAYFFDKKRDNVVLRLPAKLAPVKAAVFPIIKSPEYNKMAEEIVKDLRKEWNIVYDKSGSIGRRYSRNDEIGTPYCITIDQDSIANKDVTIRDRDTTLQIRVKTKNLKKVLRLLINGEIRFKKAGKITQTRVKVEGEKNNEKESAEITKDSIEKKD